jgi:predicted PurR-regulated permease PerM
MDTSPSRRLQASTPPPKFHALVVVGTVVLAVAALYVARPVLVLIALAMLLSFMVHPIVTQLLRLGLGRVVSVLLVVTMLFLLLAGAFWMLMIELTSLSAQIPVYRDNMITKIGHVRALGRGGALEKVVTAVTDVAKELQGDGGPPRPSATPAPVVVQPGPGFWHLPGLVETAGGSAVVIALVIFMLIEREELRNRVIRLGGYARLITTTRALDEAGQRISLYLLMQSAINTCFGLGIALSLLLAGVPYPFLWGFLAAALRFIPYVGVWLAALVVIAFSLAAFPTWHQPLLVIGCFLLLELLASFALEPLLYGHSAGVSQVALLCSVTFWAWLWGPMGLLLATPLTVCLVVLAKHVPGMEFVGILMSDEPPMAPAAVYYQRLLAMDRRQARRVLADQVAQRPIEAVYDHVILPALAHARRDGHQGTLRVEDERYIWRTTGELVEELDAGRREAARADARSEPAPPRRVRVLASPVRDEADRLGLLMLQHLVDPTRWQIEITSPHLLASELVALIEQTEPAVVCVGGLPSGGRAAHTRYLCKRIRARFPDLRIIVGRWGLREQADQVRRILEAAGADFVGFTLAETREHLQSVYGLTAPARSPEPAAAATGV